GRRLHGAPGSGDQSEPDAADRRPGLARHALGQAVGTDAVHVRQAEGQGRHGPGHEAGLDVLDVSAVVAAVDPPAVVAAGRVRYDALVAALCAVFQGGVYLDVWAHVHQPDLETFFTPWHAVLYSGFFAVAAATAAPLLRRRTPGIPWSRALPAVGGRGQPADGQGVSHRGARPLVPQHGDPERIHGAWARRRGDPHAGDLHQRDRAARAPPLGAAAARGRLRRRVRHERADGGRSA